MALIAMLSIANSENNVSEYQIRKSWILHFVYIFHMTLKVSQNWVTNF